MLDVIEQLQRYGDAVAETVEPVRAEAIGSVTTDAATHRRRPRWQPLLAAAAVVGLLAGGYWFASSASDSAPPAAPSPSPRPAPGAGAHPAVELLDAGPLTPRAGAAVAWTGTELVVWGGAVEPVNQGRTGPDRQFSDGAAFNPTTHRWQMMSPGPLPANYNASYAVTTDAGVVIARGTQVALWDPNRNTWRALDDAPAPVSDLTSVGAELVSVTADATLDPSTGRWQALPAPPVTLARPVAAWNGTELVVVGRAGATTRALAFTPHDRAWRELPTPPDLDGIAGSADHDGDRVIFVDYEMHAAAFQAGAWTALPPVPARFSEYTPTVVAIPPTLIVSTQDAVAVLIDNVWTPIPKGALDFWGSGFPTPVAGAVRDSSSLFVYGMTTSGQSRLARVDPVQLATTTPTLQVGEMTLHVPSGMKLVHSDYTIRSDEQTVLVTLSTPTGNCDVTSTYDNGAGGGTHPWSASGRGTTWRARATSTDAVRVVCGSDPATAKQIVDATSVPVAAPGTGG